jgi:hypothetical protein
MINRTTMVLMAALFMVLLPVLSMAGTVDLPRTGQTTIYATGDDGDIHAGVEWPYPRFAITYCDTNGPCLDQSSDCDSDASTDIVTDNLTGLVWSRDGNLPVGTRTWADAPAYVNGLTLCGYGDWRLPNVNELESLINAGEPYTAAWLNGQDFSNVQAGIYWSSTTYARFTDCAWGVSMWYGDVAYDVKGSSHYVWPVRAGQ